MEENNIQTQVKKLQLINCFEHAEFSSQLNHICSDQQCKQFLKVLCSKCIQNHPKHDSKSFLNLKQVLTQLTDIYVNQFNQNQNDKEKQQQQQISEVNQKNKQELFKFAKDFKVIAMQCNEIYDLIIQKINEIFIDQSDKKQNFYQFLSIISNINQQSDLQKQIDQFKENIQFINQLPLLNFNMKTENNKLQHLSSELKQSIEQINNHLQLFIKDASVKIQQPQQMLNLSSQINQGPLSPELKCFFQWNIPFFNELNIVQIQPRFSQYLCLSDFYEIGENGRKIKLKKSGCDYYYALLDDELSKYKNKIVYFEMTVNGQNKCRLGISEITKAKEINYRDLSSFSYQLCAENGQVRVMGQNRNKSDFIIRNNLKTKVYFIFNSYKNEFFLVNKSDGRFAKFQPDMSLGKWTWSIGTDSINDEYEIL